MSKKHIEISRRKKSDNHIAQEHEQAGAGKHRVTTDTLFHQFCITECFAQRLYQKRQGGAECQSNEPDDDPGLRQVQKAEDHDDCCRQGTQQQSKRRDAVLEKAPEDGLARGLRGVGDDGQSATRPGAKSRARKP